MKQLSKLLSSAVAIMLIVSILSIHSFAAFASSPNLVVSSIDSSNNPITGYWTVVSQSGSTVQTGFTPASFALASGTYTVSVSDYGSFFFDHWSDGITTREHQVTIGGAPVSLAAVYSTSPQTSATGININSQYSDGSPLVGMYVLLEQGAVTVDSGFTPVSFTSASSGQTYAVIAEDYTNAYFSHWSDGTTTPGHVVTPSGSAISLTAIYTKTKVVPPPTSSDFTMVAWPPIFIVQHGTSDGPAITAASTTSTPASIVLSVSNLPAGVTTSFSPSNQITAPPNNGNVLSESIVDLTASPSVPIGTYNVTIIATTVDGKYSHSTTVSMIVTDTTDAPPPAIEVDAQDMAGNTLTGYWTAVSQNGGVVESGFTPISWTLSAPGTYTVSVGDYGGYYFSHWSDGTTSREHQVTLSQTSMIQLTAVYSTTG